MFGFSISVVSIQYDSLKMCGRFGTIYTEWLLDRCAFRSSKMKRNSGCVDIRTKKLI